ncbi:hypothetical protein ACXDF8_20950 [Mycolicibacterium sp. CBM1]
MTNVVFIDGLWIASTAWQPWIDHFAARGHQAVAPSWPGEQATIEATRQNPAAQAGAVTDFHAFEGRGQSLTIDRGWREVADTALDWLAGQGTVDRA